MTGLGQPDQEDLGRVAILVAILVAEQNIGGPPQHASRGVIEPAADRPPCSRTGGNGGELAKLRR